LFMDLAAYAIITENNAAQHYESYGFNHPLFTNNMRWRICPLLSTESGAD
jgi:hypothetical protein